MYLLRLSCAHCGRRMHLLLAAVCFVQRFCFIIIHLVRGDSDGGGGTSDDDVHSYCSGFALQMNWFLADFFLFFFLASASMWMQTGNDDHH